jgi:hypothetical protein
VVNTLQPEVIRYLQHAGFRDRVMLPREVDLTMHGEIKLKQQWLPFEAKQWLDPHRGFQWDATIHKGRFAIKGFDRYCDGSGEMRWRMGGIIPLVHEDSPDISQSARGRLISEAIWSPGALHPALEVDWSKTEDNWLQAQWQVDGNPAELRIKTNATGEVLQVKTMRWGNPDETTWRYILFGGIATDEKTFEGITIPTKISAGWWFGTDRFAEEGEFIRVTIDTLTTA